MVLLINVKYTTSTISRIYNFEHHSAVTLLKIKCQNCYQGTAHIYSVKSMVS